MPWSPTQSGNMSPARFFPNVQITDPAGGTNSGIFIPFSNLESYKVTTSGDIREFAYSVLDKVASGIAVLTTSNRPTKFNISKNVSASETSAQKTFIVSFNLNSANTVYDVQDE